MDKTPLKLILFDLDGTLYHSTPLLHEAYSRAVERYRKRTGHDLHPPDEEEIFSRVGKPVDEFYPRLFPDLGGSELEELKGMILEEQVDSISGGKGILTAGAHEVLRVLRSAFRMGLVTNARRPYMETVLETHELADYFERARCIGDVEGNKKSILVRGMLEAFGTAPERTLLIGDRASDCRAARDTGSRFIGCHFGFGEADEFDGAPRLRRLTQLLSHPPVKRVLEGSLASTDG